MSHPLDDPATSSLRGRHATFAVPYGDNILVYPTDVATFTSHPNPLSAQDWDALGQLSRDRGVITLRGLGIEIPQGWTIHAQPGLVQFDGSDLVTRTYPNVDKMTKADVPELSDLVERTKPGPFFTRSIEMGGFWGRREGGKLVAMAGIRLLPEGWAEISGVCTDPSVRGRGYATELILTVAHAIRERGDRPFLHTSADNHTAISLYNTMGFKLRLTSQLHIIEVN